MLVEDKLFATLDPTSRRLRFPREREVIVTDTVGFIRDLPADLVDAFRATLEELRDADLFLHVVDAVGAGLRAPHRDGARACSTSMDLDDTPELLVFNQIDRLAPGDGETIAARAGGVAVSALRGLGLRELLEQVEKTVWRESVSERTRERLTSLAGDDETSRPRPVGWEHDDAFASKITGTGMYVPARVVTNHDLAKRMDTSDEWIRSARASSSAATSTAPRRPPISPSTRRGARSTPPASAPTRSTASSSRRSRRRPTSRARRSSCTTGSACPRFPASTCARSAAASCTRSRAPTASSVRARCGACSSSAAEVHSTGLDFSTRGRDTAVLFGDGAGAVVVEANDDADDRSGLLAIRMHAQGEHARRLWIEAPGSGF